MEIERLGEVALVRLRGGKANAMTREVLEGIVRLFDQAEASDARAIVVTGYEKYFSAGLAIPAILPLDRSGMRAFIDLFGAAMLRVFRCELPVVAAVNGHAIAGGCVLALQADARLMADGDARIGLNEVRLGMGLPASVVEPLRLVVPPSSLVPIALEGALYAPADALRLGLVDEVVPAAELEDRAVARARALAQGTREALAQVKRSIRRPALEAIEKHGGPEAQRWLDTWFSPGGRERLESAVARLGKQGEK